MLKSRLPTSVRCAFRFKKQVLEPDYLNPKFDYENWQYKSEQEQELLDKEQKDLIRFSFNYLFLHGEKLVVTIDENGRDFRVELGL